MSKICSLEKATTTNSGNKASNLLTDVHSGVRTAKKTGILKNTVENFARTTSNEIAKKRQRKADVE